MTMFVGILFVMSAAAFLSAMVLIIRKRMRRALMFGYCTRAADGTVYIRDPKTGTEHKFADIVAKRMVGQQSELSARQRRKIRRTAKQIAAGVARSR